MAVGREKDSFTIGKNWRKKELSATSSKKVNVYIPPDYKKMVLSTRQLWKMVGEGAVLSAVIAFLFYRSLWGLCLSAIVIPMCIHRKKEKEQKVREQRMQIQFQAAIRAISGALTAGYSLESAWRYAMEELERLYGTTGEIYREFYQMNQKIRMNEPVEQLLCEFAERSGNEDICRFSDILLYVKRSGGNLTEIIRKTGSRMQEKYEIMREIETGVAAKRAEQKMMMLLLPGILFFVTLSSPEYSSHLYRNPPGVVVMSICLLGYVGAFLWSEKIMDIPV